MTDTTAAEKRRALIRDSLTTAAETYAEAVRLEDWRTLGYPDLESWRDSILEHTRFTADTRRAIVAALTGLSTGQVAAATGVDRKTIQRDRRTATSVAPRTTPQPRGEAPRTDVQPERDSTAGVEVRELTGSIHHRTGRMIECPEPGEYQEWRRIVQELWLKLPDDYRKAHPIRLPPGQPKGP